VVGPQCAVIPVPIFEEVCTGPSSAPVCTFNPADPPDANVFKGCDYYNQMFRYIYPDQFDDTFDLCTFVLSCRGCDRSSGQCNALLSTALVNQPCTTPCSLTNTGVCNDCGECVPDIDRVVCPNLNQCATTVCHENYPFGNGGSGPNMLNQNAVSYIFNVGQTAENNRSGAPNSFVQDSSSLIFQMANLLTGESRNQSNLLCTETFKPSGTFCRLNDSCVRAAACNGEGLCLSTSTVVCPPPGNNPCLLPGVCSSNAGGCVYPARPDGTICDDFSLCTPGKHLIGNQ